MEVLGCTEKFMFPFCNRPIGKLVYRSKSPGINQLS